MQHLKLRAKFNKSVGISKLRLHLTSSHHLTAAALCSRAKRNERGETAARIQLDLVHSAGEMAEWLRGRAASGTSVQFPAPMLDSS